MTTCRLLRPQQLGHGPFAAAQLPSHIGQRDPFQVVRLHSPALIGWQAGQCVSQGKQFFLSDGLLARGRLRCSEPGSYARRGRFDGCLQRAFPIRITRSSAELADLVSQVVCQNLPQPCGSERIVAIRKLGQGLVGFQQGLLDHAGQIDLPLQLGIELESGQQAQVVAEAFQFLVRAARFLGHCQPPTRISVAGQQSLRAGGGIGVI